MQKKNTIKNELKAIIATQRQRMRQGKPLDPVLAREAKIRLEELKKNKTVMGVAS